MFCYKVINISYNQRFSEKGPQFDPRWMHLHIIIWFKNRFTVRYFYQMYQISVWLMNLY